MIIYPSQAIAIVRDHLGTDGLPSASAHTAVLWKNGATTAVTVTVTTPTVGVYKFAFTIPADAAQGDVYSLRAIDADGYAATVWEGITDLRIDVIDDFLDTELAAIKTKTDFLPSATAGAAGGLFIAGANAATTAATWTVTGATTHTGNVVMNAGLTIAQSTLNEKALSITGNGTGQGILVTGGTTGDAVQIVAGTNGIGLLVQGNGSGDGVHMEAGATGEGMHILGGVTSGSAMKIEAQGTNDHAMELVSIGTGDGIYVDSVTVTGAMTVGTNAIPWNAAWATAVNAEMLDVLAVDVFAELASVPAATSTLKDKLTWLFMYARNKSTETATQRKLFADNQITVVGTEGVTDELGTFTKTEVV